MLKELECRVKAKEINFWRKFCCLTIFNKVNNIINKVNSEKDLTDILEKRQLIWHGNLKRMDGYRIPHQT